MTETRRTRMTRQGRCSGCMRRQMEILALRYRSERLEDELAEARRRLEEMGEEPGRQDAPRVLQ